MRKLRCMGAHDGKDQRRKYRMALGNALVQTAPELIQLSVCGSQSSAWEERKWGNLRITLLEEKRE